MEDVEPVEHAQEEIHEHAHQSKERWVLGVALTAALLAALAAIASSMAGHHESECILDQIKASDQWSYYQAKGIKEITLVSESRIFQAMGKPVSQHVEIERYHLEREQIKEKADELTHESEKHMKLHQVYALAVTMSQIAIAIAAISVLTKLRPFWYVSICFGGIAVFFLVMGLIP